MITVHMGVQVDVTPIEITQNSFFFLNRASGVRIASGAPLKKPLKALIFQGSSGFLFLRNYKLYFTNVRYSPLLARINCASKCASFHRLNPIVKSYTHFKMRSSSEIILMISMILSSTTSTVSFFFAVFTSLLSFPVMYLFISIPPLSPTSL